MFKSILIKTALASMMIVSLSADVLFYLYSYTLMTFNYKEIL
jgi:hypothetical protein